MIPLAVRTIFATTLITTLKIPHPIQDQHVADRNRRTICEVRGYCGPFINQIYYDQFPDPVWRGTGECIVCCNTCNVEVEEAKQRLATSPAPSPAPRGPSRIGPTHGMFFTA